MLKVCCDFNSSIVRGFGRLGFSSKVVLVWTLL
ncbi:hypothetical protein V6Z12_D07G158400 [Gossypium hirsutum]